MVGGLGSLLGLVTLFFWLSAMSTVFSELEYNNAAFHSAVQLISAEYIFEVALFGAVGLDLMMNYRNWRAAQWLALPEETRKQAIEDAEAEKYESSMFSLFRL